jgi:ABC-2 type transport system permease protein
MTMVDAAGAPAGLFRRLRRRLLHNTVRVMLDTSPVRFYTILASSLLIWVGLYAAGHAGFHLLLHDDRVPFAARIVGTLFDFLFVALMVMLFFSSGIILYGSLFASAESAFLLCTPAAADRVFAYKFQAAVAFSSWAFLLLGLPVLLAYGIVAGVPWYFFVLLPLFFAGFILIPGAAGALACLVVVSTIPQRRKHVLALACLGTALLIGILAYRINETLHAEMFDNLMDQLYSQVAFARGPLMPSHWMTRGVLALATGNLFEACYRLALIWSNGLFGYLLAAALAARLYRRAYDRIATGGDLRRRWGGAWLDRPISAMLGFLHPQTRLLIVKDFRTFRRDPAQWAQIAILCGLLIFYFISTRRFWYQEFERRYQNGISLLNLVSVSLLMCAWTGRFIYPLLSLEGRKFWILGLLPMDRDRLLWGKFAFSAMGTLLVALALMIVSDLALGMPPQAMALHFLAIVVLAFGLSGLSVGLGAWMPNFRESDPSKIAIGFGGTMNLILSLGFVVAVICLMVVPWHVAAVVESELPLADVQPNRWVLAGAGLGLAVTILAVAVPLGIGARSLRRMEF